MSADAGSVLRSRFRGALFGLAVGDALGAPIESQAPGTFKPVRDMVDVEPLGHRPGHGPGHWTDDTSMALCLAESLVECDGFDVHDQMRRYLRWFRDGYLSSTGYCFGIGNTVKAALLRFEADAEPMAGQADPHTAGNGSLMRLAPVSLAYFKHPLRAIHLSGVMSATTHAAPEAVDACRFYSGLIIAALQGVARDELLGDRFSPIAHLWNRERLSPRIDEVAAGSYKHRQRPDIRGTGYVVRSLEAALWALWHSDDFESGVLAAVNLGDDADTTGAIFGQLAGAIYGVQGIPKRWREQVVMSGRIEALADQLLAFGLAPRGGDPPDGVC